MYIDVSESDPIGTMEVGPSLVVEVGAGELGSVLDGCNAKVVSSE